MVRYMYLDISAFLLLLIMFVFAIYRKMYTQKSSKIFLAVMIICMVASVFDIISVFPTAIGFYGAWISTTIYFIFRNSMPIAYLAYIMVYIDPNRDAKINKKYNIIMSIPYFIIMLLIIINPILPNDFSVFYYTDTLEYVRGPLIYILYVTSAIYMIIGTIWIFRYRSFFLKSEIIAIILIFPLTVLSLLIQMVRKELLVELFVSSLALVLVQVVIEREEVLVDTKTLLNSKKLFIDFIKRSYYFNRVSYILLINIKNFNEIYNILNYEDATNYVHQMSSLFKNKYKNYEPDYQSFYVENDTFALVFKNENVVNDVANLILHDLAKAKFNKTKYHPNPNLCIINSINDFKTYEEFLMFTSNFYSKFNSNNKITIISQVKNDKNFIIASNIDEIIDTALLEDEIEVYYQPIINVKEKKFKSAEALIRINSKKYGLISPALFIPYAERNGKISEIDNVVMTKVFKFISSDDYKKLGLDYIEINLSMVDCMEDGLANRIISLLKEYNIDSDSINLEITESYDGLNSEISKENIKMLEEYGIKFSLDDYGTGYSNIERISKYPIKIIKIDKSLVDAASDSTMNMVLKNTFKLIKELNRETVVEGIETFEQVLMFEELGCNYIQGYYYSKPLPLNDFINFIEISNK